MSNDKHKVRVGMTVGDLNGIGIEVIIKTFMDARMFDNIVPIVYGGSKEAAAHLELIETDAFGFHAIQNVADAQPEKLNLLNCWEDDAELTIGQPSTKVGKFAFASLEAATQDLAANNIDVLVTAPIDKQTIQGPDFDFPGHTEYLAKMANEDDALMFMCAPGLRVGVVTGHVPLKDVADHISAKLVFHRIEQMHNSLVRDFQIRAPKIAVLGLNPHAGEKGMLGDEEKTLIMPAIEDAKDENMLVYGPYPADGFFGNGTFKQFDGVLAMYHDQGLAPFKALSFGMGVNYTAGLPIVRTSPDHGTGYDIAGKDQALPDSFRHAVFTACDIYHNRKIHRELTADPLKAQSDRGR
jgi:4-hydroxythreonine-4-phosphate dehydrogenase